MRRGIQGFTDIRRIYQGKREGENEKNIGGRLNEEKQKHRPCQVSVCIDLNSGDYGIFSMYL
jgi:hypothetical protein